MLFNAAVNAKYFSAATHNEATNRGYYVMQCGQRLRFLHE